MQIVSGLSFKLFFFVKINSRTQSRKADKTTQHNTATITNKQTEKKGKLFWHSISGWKIVTQCENFRRKITGLGQKSLIQFIACVQNSFDASVQTLPRAELVFFGPMVIGLLSFTENASQCRKVILERKKKKRGGWSTLSRQI